MKATALTLLAISIATLVMLGTVDPASAQSPSISTGVVTEVETDNEGRLTAFSIVNGDGSVVRFAVSASNPNTSYGLENRVGERWVSDQDSDPREAATRLKDQQNRLTQISIQSEGGAAMSVVQADSKDVDANLGYLFAVVAIAWIGIMGYVVFLGMRQRTMAAELERLRGNNVSNDS